MILEQIETRKGNELFLRITAKDTIHLISVLAEMLAKNNGSSRTVWFDDFIGNAHTQMHIVIVNDTMYAEMLKGK